jgi:hypothetical protein
MMVRDSGSWRRDTALQSLVFCLIVSASVTQIVGLPPNWLPAVVTPNENDSAPAPEMPGLPLLPPS